MYIYYIDKMDGSIYFSTANNDQGVLNRYLGANSEENNMVYVISVEHYDITKTKYVDGKFIPIEEGD